MSETHELPDGVSLSSTDAAQDSPARSRRRYGDVVAGVLTALLVLAVGGLVVADDEPGFTASGTLVVLPDADLDNQAGYFDTLSRGQIVLTFAEILNLRTPAQVPPGVAVTVQAVPDTSLIEITATAADAERAVQSADEVLSTSQSYISTLGSPYQIYPVSTASGRVEATGGVPLALMLMIPVVAIISGLAVQQGARALGLASSSLRVAPRRRAQGRVTTSGSWGRHFGRGGRLEPVGARARDAESPLLAGPPDP